MSDARYKTRRWKQRAGQQLRRHPLCAYCAAKGLTVLARVADHVIPHRGDAQLFWHGELQSLCSTCHSRDKQREEARGFNEVLGQDGWPTDPRHPANRAAAHG